MAAQSRPLLERHERQLFPDPPEYLALTDPAQRMRYMAQSSTRIKLRTARVWNWANPEVPAYKLAFVRELCEGYDIDGIELDFMRWAAYFDPEKTTPEQRKTVMADFIAQTRGILDATARGGKRRTLSVRVPALEAGFDALGVDLPQWRARGVDWVNLSCHYVSTQQTDIGRIARSVPHTPVYVELTFANAPQGAFPGGKGYGLMTPKQLCTAAYLARKRGAAGVSLFNFAYYRKLGVVAVPPPFEAVAKLGDMDFLSRADQRYFLSHSSVPPAGVSEFARHRNSKVGTTQDFYFDMTPPVSGWAESGILRLWAKNSLQERGFAVEFNGGRLERADDSKRGSEGPFEPTGDEGRMGAWRVPSAFLNDGINRLSITQLSGPATEWTFVDVDSPARSQ